MIQNKHYIIKNPYLKGNPFLFQVKRKKTFCQLGAKKSIRICETCQAVNSPKTPLWDRQCTVSANIFPFPFLLIFHSCVFTWTVNHLFVVRITNGGQARKQICRMKKSLPNPSRLQAHDMNTNCLRYALDASAERATVG